MMDQRAEEEDRRVRERQGQVRHEGAEEPRGIVTVSEALASDSALDLPGFLQTGVVKAMNRTPEEREGARQSDEDLAVARLATERRRLDDWRSISVEDRGAIWERIPEEVRAHLVAEAAEVIAQSDAEGLGAPYDDAAEALAFYIAVRSSAGTVRLQPPAPPPLRTVREVPGTILLGLLAILIVVLGGLAGLAVFFAVAEMM